MSLTITQVDAFADKPFSGNPAAVCILPKAADEQWMQNVAMEMNLSETAFLVPRSNGFDLRWFTPTVEVALCGHATIASAHVLWESGVLKPDQQARFHTKSGVLTADKKGEWIELNFPATPASPIEPPMELLYALGIHKHLFTGKTRFDFLIETESEDVVRTLTPDFGKLRKQNIRGVMVTAKSTTAGFDFISRFFAPGSGIDEDPATGSAHCALGPYWQSKLGKSQFTGYQASKRGAVVRVAVQDHRVLLGGKAVTVLTGELKA
jgi:PhzF family phenazine biosynthesis protein